MTACIEYCMNETSFSMRRMNFLLLLLTLANCYGYGVVFFFVFPTSRPSLPFILPALKCLCCCTRVVDTRIAVYFRKNCVCVVFVVCLL